MRALACANALERDTTRTVALKPAVDGIFRLVQEDIANEQRQRAQHPVVRLHRVHTRTQTHTSPEMEGGKREIWGGVWVGGNVHVQAWAIAQRDALLTFAVSLPPHPTALPFLPPELQRT